MTRPFTPGAEAAGVVRSDRQRRHGFSVGDRVVSQAVKGAYAEQAVVAGERAVRIPPGVTTKQAAAACLQGLTAHYLATSTLSARARTSRARSRGGWRRRSAALPDRQAARRVRHRNGVDAGETSSSRATREPTK